MAIEITKIEFENFRQYKNLSVDFSNVTGNALHVLVAQNGTGKTTFLNGITWCLYGEEKDLSYKDKALQIANESVVNQTELDGSVCVTVRIKLFDSEINSFIEFTRKQSFIVKLDQMTSAKKTINGKNELSIAIVEKNNKNSKIIDDQEEADRYVDLYFNRNIYEYYFFNGEKLNDYFAEGKSQKIKESIFNISQVTLLENTSKRTESLSGEKSRKANKNNPNTLLLIKQRDELKDIVKERNEQIKKGKERMPQLLADKKKADDIISNYGPVKASQIRRNEKTKELKRLQDELNVLRQNKNEFIQEYLILLHFYPRIKNTYDMICRKEKNNELPPNINKSEIKAIVDKHMKNCPVCNSELNEEAFDYLQKLLDETSVSTGTSHQLMKIKSSLEEMISDVSQYEKKKKTILEKEKNIRDDISDVEKALQEIHAYLVNYPSDNIEADIAKAEKELKYINDQISEINSNEASSIAYNKRDEDKLRELERDINYYEDQKKIRDKLSKECSVYRKVTTSFENIQNKIMYSMKDEIERDTWKLFDSMVWKSRTYKSLSISPNYDLAVYNMDNKIMTGSLSAAEFMALAYSFTLAIHNASGKNCPLVVDSPLGRTSDKNREKMATTLLNISKNKQIIMLFSPDEYSNDVKNIYKDKASSIRVFKLTDDETEVKED